MSFWCLYSVFKKTPNSVILMSFWCHFDVILVSFWCPLSNGPPWNRKSVSLPSALRPIQKLLSRIRQVSQEAAEHLSMSATFASKCPIVTRLGPLIYALPRTSLRMGGPRSTINESELLTLTRHSGGGNCFDNTIVIDIKSINQLNQLYRFSNKIDVGTGNNTRGRHWQINLEKMNN